MFWSGFFSPTVNAGAIGDFVGRINGDKKMKSLHKVNCEVCKKSIIEGEEFAVIQVAGFLAHGFMSGINDKVIKFYLCSSSCRSKHIGTFWRQHFPVEE